MVFLYGICAISCGRVGDTANKYTLGVEHLHTACMHVHLSKSLSYDIVEMTLDSVEMIPIATIGTST